MAKGEQKNTKYFHTVTAERRKRNKIEMLKSNDGIECRSEKEITGEIVKYFESLSTTNNPKHCDEILEEIPRTISKSMNRNLTRSVEDQEIKVALFSMNPHKSPKPDGTSRFFF